MSCWNERPAGAENREVWDMLRLTMAQEEYLMIGENVKIVFLGGTGRHMRVMIDAPKEINIVRSNVLEKNKKQSQE